MEISLSVDVGLELFGETISNNSYYLEESKKLNPGLNGIWIYSCKNAYSLGSSIAED